MKIHLCEQRTPEWYAARAGRITASESGAFVLNTGKVADGAKQKLIDKKLAEHAGEFEETFVNDAMKRGIALEELARMEYAKIIGDDVREVGFVSHDTHLLGCSPDGIIHNSLADHEDSIAAHLVGGVEIKCPSGATQIRYLRDAVLPDEYKHQVHHTMAILGTPWHDFFSYCPRVTEWIKTREKWTPLEWENGKLPVFYIRVHRDGFTEQLLGGLIEMSDELKRQIDWLENL